MELPLVSSRSALALMILGAAFAAGCGDDSGHGVGGSGGSSSIDTGAGAGSPEQTGQECTDASECYPNVADGELAGDAICLDKVRGGYCTHACEADDDCCGAEGECDTDLAQVCSPFSSTDGKMCFLSCEKDELGNLDESSYCQREAGRDFICKSSGGGNENRKVCVPGDCGVGAACSATADCTGDLECVTTLDGGYCSKRDCTVDADCPEDTRCVEQALSGGERVCLKRCSADSDCSFCRGDDLAAVCDDQVDFLDGTGEPVCVPQDF